MHFEIIILFITQLDEEIKLILQWLVHIRWIVKLIILVTVLRILLTEHSYTPVSSLYALVNIISTVILVTFPSLVDIDRILYHLMLAGEYIGELGELVDNR